MLAPKRASQNKRRQATADEMPRQALPGGWREMWLAPGCCASLGALAAHGWSIAAAGAETHTSFTRPLKPEPRNSLGICRGYLSSPLPALLSPGSILLVYRRAQLQTAGTRAASEGQRLLLMDKQ